MIKFLEKDKDYKSSFPYGHWAEPQIKIISGKYKGLIFDIMSSGVITTPLGSTLNVDYKIIKHWNDTNLDISDEDKQFICYAAYNFIRDFNYEVTKEK